MEFAKRLDRLGTESAFEVLAEVNALKNKGANILSFCIGEPDFDTPKNIRESAKKAIDENQTHYGPSPGIDLMRKSVAKYISKTRKISVEPEEVMITPGGKTIIFYTFMALVNEGDEVIYPNPGYPIYESMANFVGAKAIPLPLLESKNFTFDINDLKKIVSNKTKLLVLNSPQNPTGGVLTDEDLKAVADLAKKYNFYVLSDEIYSRILYEGEHRSIISLPGMKERTVLLDGHSKCYAMTGWRLGYGVMPKELVFWFSKLQINANSCTCTFTQIAGAEALDGPQVDTDKMVAEFKARRDLIVDGLNKIKGFSCLKPKGAFYVFVNVTKACQELGFSDSKELQRYLLYDGNVAVLPRTSFGVKNTGEDQEYIRLSYATSRENIKNGVAMIKTAIEDTARVKKYLSNLKKTN